MHLKSSLWLAIEEKRTCGIAGKLGINTLQLQAEETHGSFLPDVIHHIPE
jgi:hypothetical protein